MSPAEEGADYDPARSAGADDVPAWSGEASESTRATAAIEDLMSVRDLIKLFENITDTHKTKAAATPAPKSPTVSKWQKPEVQVPAPEPTQSKTKADNVFQFVTPSVQHQQVTERDEATNSTDETERPHPPPPERPESPDISQETENVSVRSFISIFEQVDPKEKQEKKENTIKKSTLTRKFSSSPEPVKQQVARTSITVMQPQPQVMAPTSPKAAEPENDNTLLNFDVFEDTTETVVSSTTVDVNDNNLAKSASINDLVKMFQGKINDDHLTEPRSTSRPWASPSNSSLNSG